MPKKVGKWLLFMVFCFSVLLISSSSLEYPKKCRIRISKCRNMLSLWERKVQREFVPLYCKWQQQERRWVCAHECVCPLVVYHAKKNTKIQFRRINWQDERPDKVFQDFLSKNFTILFLSLFMFVLPSEEKICVFHLLVVWYSIWSSLFYPVSMCAILFLFFLAYHCCFVAYI